MTRFEDAWDLAKWCVWQLDIDGIEPDSIDVNRHRVRLIVPANRHSKAVEILMLRPRDQEDLYRDGEPGKRQWMRSRETTGTPPVFAHGATITVLSTHPVDVEVTP